MAHTCGTCGHSWSVEGEVNVHCGAAWENRDGVKPIWAERQSSTVTILLMAAGKQSALKAFDPENMPRDDGKTCKIWKQQ